MPECAMTVTVTPTLNATPIRRSHKLKQYQIQSLKKQIEDSISAESSDALGAAVKEEERQRAIQERHTRQLMVKMKRDLDQKRQTEEQSLKVRLIHVHVCTHVY